jgi:hypothetical protein
MNKRSFLKLLAGGTIAVSVGDRLKIKEQKASTMTESMSHPWLKSCGIVNELNNIG